MQQEEYRVLSHRVPAHRVQQMKMGQAEQVGRVGRVDQIEQVEQVEQSLASFP